MGSITGLGENRPTRRCCDLVSPLLTAAKPAISAVLRPLERSLKVPSCGEWAVVAAAGDGSRGSGCGRSHRSVRCRSSVSGRQRGSPSPASKSTQSHSAMPPLARGNCSQTRLQVSEAPLGLGVSESRGPALSTIGTLSFTGRSRVARLRICSRQDPRLNGGENYRRNRWRLRKSTWSATARSNSVPT